MKKAILINNNNIEFSASAATPFLYKKIFGADLLVALTELRGKTETSDRMELLNIVQRLAFVMYCEANIPQREIFGKSEEDFYIWLMNYDNLTDADFIAEILGIWTDSTKTTSKPKKG